MSPPATDEQHQGPRRHLAGGGLRRFFAFGVDTRGQRASVRAMNATRCVHRSRTPGLCRFDATYTVLVCLNTSSNT